MGQEGATSRIDKELRALRTRRGRERTGRFMAEGIRVVEDLLASRLDLVEIVESSTLSDSERGQMLSAAFSERGLPVEVLHERDFDKLADTEHSQGVIAIARIPRYDLADLRPPLPAVLLVLDAIQDPGNFGTLVRSAEALGVGGVVTLAGTVDPWNPKSVRSAAGSSFRIPLYQSDTGSVIGRLKEAGYRLLGADQNGEPVRGSPGDPVALVLGNEGNGLSPEVRGQVDGLVGIPIRGRAESLNVGAAGAILLYELCR